MDTRTMLERRIRIDVLLVLVVALLAPRAQAVTTFPGQNGLLSDVREEEWARLMRDPVRHLIAARVAFLKGESGQAADQIRVAAAYVRLRADAAVLPEGRQTLWNAFLRLEALAYRVRDREIREVVDLDQAFSRVSLAFVRRALLRVERDLDLGQKRDAGVNLLSAAFHLEQADAWNLIEADEAHRGALSTARRLGGSLIEGGTVPKAETREVLDALGAQIATISQAVSRSSPESEPRLSSSSPGEAATGATTQEVWSRLSVEFLGHGHQAREWLQIGEVDLALEELHHLASLLLLERTRATNDEEHALLEAARARLWGPVEPGEDRSPPTVRRLCTDLARAEVALSRFHRRLARDAWVAGDQRTAGFLLRSAASHLSSAGGWIPSRSNEGPDSGIPPGFIARSLIEGSPLSQQQVDRCLAELERRISELGAAVGAWSESGR